MTKEEYSIFIKIQTKRMIEYANKRIKETGINDFNLFYHEWINLYAANFRKEWEKCYL